jgi:hypothetical protein
MMANTATAAWLRLFLEQYAAMFHHRAAAKDLRTKDFTNEDNA